MKMLETKTMIPKNPEKTDRSIFSLHATAAQLTNCVSIAEVGIDGLVAVQIRHQQEDANDDAH